MFQGKNKALTFSYDDGVLQDQRLINIFNRYGLKGTFNLNSELLGKDGDLVRNGRHVDHIKVKPEDVRYVYEEHEVAAHTLTHPNLTRCTDDEVIRQVEEDRLKLSEMVGYEVIGMAYPGGGVNNNEHVAQLVQEHTGIQYARSTVTTGSFAPFRNLYRYEGTLYHHEEWDRLFALGEEFLQLQCDTPQVFYIWGHAYEFDIYPERWERFEEFCRMMSGHEDIFYGTNREVLLHH